MIARGTEGGSMFGSGHLLDDLISYVYQGEGNRLMLIGDKAQLRLWESKKPPRYRERCSRATD